MTTKTGVITLSLVTLVGVGTLGASRAFAQNTNSSSFVKSLAQKLGIDESKVQQAVDSVKSDHKQTVQTRVNTRLDKLVSQGKITDAQKQAILTELQTLNTKYHLEDTTITKANRRQAMQNMRQEFTSWAKSQNIDISQLKMGFGIGLRKGLKTSITPTPTS